MKRLFIAAGLTVGLLGACAEAGEGPMAPEEESTASTGPVLVECPVSETRSTSATIDLLGGTVSLDGHSITLPEGAVLLPTQITLTAPASNYMEIDIRANDLESFEFEQPVSVAVSYQRCTRSNLDKATLSAWHIDTTTKALLEDMGGVDDKTARTVTFESGHLSGFAIAN